MQNYTHFWSIFGEKFEAPPIGFIDIKTYVLFIISSRIGLEHEFYKIQIILIIFPNFYFFQKFHFFMIFIRILDPLQSIPTENKCL
jgi:cellulose synthase/poly-beta-1,6-N-acetylglucosamine synthase-like glycosyltransferase